MEPAHPGMHTTDTVDFDVVISGEVWLELDDGAEVRLGPGDCVVQNGTRHRWHNRASRPCVIAVALLGMTRPTPDR
jgi:quercetin dioxygenase-like cupin family protein